MISMKKRSGSSSILVILTFLLLMVFSVLAMSSSYADYRLASKNAQWTREYYILEGEAQAFINSADDILKNYQDSELVEIGNHIHAAFPDADVEEFSEGIQVSRIFESESGKKLLLQLELFQLDMSGFSVKSIRALPEVLRYDDSIHFEDVEVIEP
jgi:hypothetical protein